jgi:hypothetical protein
VCLNADPLQSKPLPKIEAATLTGRIVALPNAFQGRPSVVLLGFSKNAGYQAQDWVKPLYKEYGQKVGVFQVPIIEAVPRILRGYAQKMMRQITPEALYDQVLLLDKGEKAWHTFLAHRNDDDIHVIVIDQEGRIEHRFEGRYNEPAYREVKAVLERLQRHNAGQVAAAQ